MPATRWAIRIYEARLFVRGKVNSLGADCIEKQMRDEHKADAARLLEAAGIDGEVDVRGVPPLRLGPQALPFPHRQRRSVLMGARITAGSDTPPRKSATFDEYTLVGDPPRRGDRHLRHPRRRRQAQGAAFRRSAVPRRLDQPLSARRLSREVRHRRDARHALRQEADRLKIPITIAGMSFGSLSAPGQGSARPRRHARGHLDDHRRRRHDAEERGHSKTLVYQIPAVALRHEPGRPAQGRRHRGRRRPGRQAGRRRHAARPEDFRPRRRDAHAAEGIDQRSACRHPDWTGPDDLEIKIQELREITDWEKPIYVKVGARAALLRHRAGGEGGRRRGRARRHAGRHGRHPGSLHRACRHADACRHQAGGAGAAGPRHAPQGAADRLRRHPQRRRCRQGAGARRRRGGDRHGGAGGARRQRPASRGRIHALGTAPGAYDDWHEGSDPGRHHDAGPRTDAAARPGRGRTPAGQLPEGDDAGGADHRAGLRQEPRAQSGARRSGGADHRGRGHGGRAARRHRLDTGPELLLNETGAQP